MAEPGNKRGKFDTVECSICYAEPPVNKTLLPCGHIFCLNCVKTCHKEQAPNSLTINCPMCRATTNEVEHSGKRKYTFNKKMDNDAKKRRTPRRRKRVGKNKQPPTAD